MKMTSEPDSLITNQEMYEQLEVKDTRKQKKCARGLKVALFGITVLNLVLISLSIGLAWIFLYSPILKYQDKIEGFIAKLNSLANLADGLKAEIGMINNFINITTPVIVSLRNFICQMYPKDCPS